ncbi:MAG: AraC family transcriptional regulator [Eubacteriales bacterium]|nr:AraC family transcriptional regulator [Eubacteriales bacterium]
MKIDFYRTEDPAGFVPARLFYVYFIDADRSYKGIRGVSRERRGYAAVRTVSGCGVMDVFGRRNILLPAGSLFVVPAWKLITYRPKEDRWLFRWFEFDAPAAVIGEKVYDFPVSAEELASLDAVFGTIRRGERRDLESASALFTSVLYTWKERIESGENKKNPGKLSGIAEMIVRDRQKNYTVDELAGLCALSVRRFREVFERKFGLPPKKYILKAKMERAYELLISTSMSVSAVAESVGYADGFYFSKAFRQFFGLSPSGVRKNAALLSD